MSRKTKQRKPLGLFDKLTENRVPGDPFTKGDAWQRMSTRTDGTRRYRHRENHRGLEVWSDPWDHGYNVITGFWIGYEWHPDALKQSVRGPFTDLTTDGVISVLDRLAELDRREPWQSHDTSDFAGFPAVETTS